MTAKSAVRARAVEDAAISQRAACCERTTPSLASDALLVTMMFGIGADVSGGGEGVVRANRLLRDLRGDVRSVAELERAIAADRKLHNLALARRLRALTLTQLLNLAQKAFS
jgi:hypothetical protein